MASGKYRQTLFAASMFALAMANEKAAETKQPKHCDDYIDDPTQPECLREFLDHSRAPAHGRLRDTPKPKLFATFEGKRVRVTMASRFGDVGITTDLTRENGYERRVSVEQLSDFSALAKATPHA